VRQLAALPIIAERIHLPYTDIQNPTAVLEHEATPPKSAKIRSFYCNQRGLGVKKKPSDWSSTDMSRKWWTSFRWSSPWRRRSCCRSVWREVLD